MKNGNKNIVVFDGVCILCNKTVQWIIRNDSKSKFRFTSAQSKMGQLLLKEHVSADSFKSILYITDNRVYLKSTAVLRILRGLDGGFQLLYSFITEDTHPVKNHDIFIAIFHKLMPLK